MHRALQRVDHRPWPLPAERWTWRQNWHDLLFAHWPVPVSHVRPLVPERLEVDEYDGMTWVGVVPFRMTGVMRRGLPDLPWISAFPELNLRLYVTCQDKPGVFFLSLDAANPLAVWAARRFFHLPYHYARMSLVKDDSTVRFESQRRSATQLCFSAQYRPTSAVYESRRGTLEYFLTERYCLYALKADGTLLRCQVHHAPWPLQRAEADIFANELARPFELQVDTTPALLHFARRIDVVVWSPQQIQ